MVVATIGLVLVDAPTTKAAAPISIARQPINTLNLPVTLFADENVNITAAGEDITCVGGALGYITCPLIDITSTVILFVSRFLDNIFNFQVLKDDGVRGAWGIFVNLANISLAVGFMFVVMSQATSMGISTYGVKRMLPRMVAAAILINMSFYVCALAIDVSNVLGHNMQSFVSALTPKNQNNAKNDSLYCKSLEKIMQLGAGATPNLPSVPFVEDPGDAVNNAIDGVEKSAIGRMEAASGCSLDKAKRGLSGGITIVTIIVAVGLIAVFIAFITTMALAIIRYVVLIFLILLAPLAFAAMVLPNTEAYFKKWWNLFLKLLMIYPAAMFLFSGSIFAAYLIGQLGAVRDGAFVEEMFKDSKLGPDAAQAIWATVQLFVIAMPLFIIPKLFKSMDSITGGIAGKLAAGSTGVMAKLGKKGSKFAGKKAAPYAKFAAAAALDGIGSKNSKLGSFVRKTRARDMAIKQALEARKQGKLAERQELATSIGDSSPLIRGVGGSRYDEIIGAQVAESHKKRVAAKQQALTRTGEANNVDAMAKYMRDAMPLDQNGNLIKERFDATTFEAAAGILSKSGSPGQNAFHSVMKSMDGKEVGSVAAASINNALKESYGDMIGKRGDLAKSWAAQDKDTGKHVFGMGNVGQLGTSQLATQTAATLHEGALNNKISVIEAQTILSSPQLNSSVTDATARGILQAVANGQRVPSDIEQVVKVSINPPSSTTTQNPSSGPSGRGLPDLSNPGQKFRE